MRATTIREALTLMVQESIYGIVECFKRFKKQQTPSLLAYNVAWFTTCSWLEQLHAFDQIDNWLDTGKGNYLYK